MGKLTTGLFQKLGYDAISVDPKNPDSPEPSETVKWTKGAQYIF